MCMASAFSMAIADILRVKFYASKEPTMLDDDDGTNTPKHCQSPYRAPYTTSWRGQLGAHRFGKLLPPRFEAFQLSQTCICSPITSHPCDIKAALCGHKRILLRFPSEPPYLQKVGWRSRYLLTPGSC